MSKFKERIELLRDLMVDKGIDYYIIPTADPHGSEYIDEYYKEREYMSGFTGSAGTLIVSKDEAALFVDGRYHIQADDETDSSIFTVYKLGLEGVKTPSEYLADNTVEGIKIGFDGRCFLENTFETIKEKILSNVNSNRKSNDNDINVNNKSNVYEINEDGSIQFSVEEDLVDIIWNDRPSRSKQKAYVLQNEAYSVDTTDKIKFIKEFIKKKSIDGVFISELSDIMWLFNIRGNDIMYNPVAYSYAYITNDVAILYLQKDAYEEELCEYAKSCNFMIADYEDIEIELAKIKGKTIAIDKNSTNCLNYKILDCGNNIVEVDNCEFVKKHIKDENEINCIRKYHEIDAVSMIKFIIYIKDSVKDLNEYSAACYLDELRRKNDGFKDLSFDTISAYAENAAIVHYSPSKSNSKKLEQKGMLLVDSGAQYIGATTDITRTISLGPVTEEEKINYTLVLKGNLRLMSAVFLKGTRCENLDILAREALWKAGLDYRHGTGHGIGAFLNVHEGPYSIRYRINSRQPELEAGAVISDEPGVYIAGRYGIRHETQLLVVEKFSNEYGTFLGFEPLSLVPFEKEMIVRDLMTKDEIDALNNYHDLCYRRVSPLLNEAERYWFKNATTAL